MFSTLSQAADSSALAFTNCLHKASGQPGEVTAQGLLGSFPDTCTALCICIDSHDCVGGFQRPSVYLIPFCWLACRLPQWLFTTLGSCKMNQLSLIFFDKGFSLDKLRVRLNKNILASGLFHGTTRLVIHIMTVFCEGDGRGAPNPFCSSGGCQAANFHHDCLLFVFKATAEQRRGHRNGASSNDVEFVVRTNILPFFLNKDSLDYFKSLANFQSSRKVDSNTFCQFPCCCSGAGNFQSGGSLCHHFC